MSLEGIKQVTEAEEMTQRRKAEAQAQAKKTVSDARRAGEAALAAARPRGEQLFTGSLLGLKYFFASFGARMADTRTLRGLSCPGDLLSRPDLCAGLERWGRDWAARLAEARP